ARRPAEMATADLPKDSKPHRPVILKKAYPYDMPFQNGKIDSSALRAPPLREEAKLAPLLEELAAVG
ncbi:MAG: hypothetical protein ACLR5S_06690, partial [Ruminococcus sp.]